LQQEKPADYVLATGITTSVRTFCELAAEACGFQLVWNGEGPEAQGIDRASGKQIIRINPKSYRPAEVDLLVGDASKAHDTFGWKSNVALPQLISMMVEADLRRVGSGEMLL
jgi:GDPmannose 4,6-dehydratase